MFYTISSIAKLCDRLHAEGKQIVLATGFFDLLHAEHLNFLTKAKEAGDVLIVAVESDVRARKLKGEGRPVETQSLRCQHVAAYADYVVSLPDDFDNFAAYDSLMAAIKPAVYAVSSHTSYQDTKQQLTKKYGGELRVVHDFNPEVSTTQIVNRKNQL
jgi:rfaE bifunctional protein nucleotidyltransferase chain/domain